MLNILSSALFRCQRKSQEEPDFVELAMSNPLTRTSFMSEDLESARGFSKAFDEGGISYQIIPWHIKQVEKIQQANEYKDNEAGV
jgi:hypothetical protein